MIGACGQMNEEEGVTINSLTHGQLILKKGAKTNEEKGWCQNN